MRNQINTNAVVNVVDREDRVSVIGCLVAQRLHLRLKQLQSFATAYAKPGMPRGTSHSPAEYWRECTRTSAPLMFAGNNGLSLSGPAILPVGPGSRLA